MFIALKSMADTTVKIRVEREYEACCVLRRLGQFLILFASLALFIGAEDLVMDCLGLSGIQAKLLLIQIL